MNRVVDLTLAGPPGEATNWTGRMMAEAAGIARAEDGVRQSGVVLGGVARTAEQANQMIDRGYRALVLGFDWSLLQRGITASLEGIRQ